MFGIQELCPELEKAISAALREERPDNPIYRAAQAALIEQSVEKGDPNTYIIQQLNLLERELRDIRRSFSRMEQLGSSAMSSGGYYSVPEVFRFRVPNGVDEHPIIKRMNDELDCNIIVRPLKLGGVEICLDTTASPASIAKAKEIVHSMVPKQSLQQSLLNIFDDKNS